MSIKNKKDVKKYPKNNVRNRIKKTSRLINKDRKRDVSDMSDEMEEVDSLKKSDGNKTIGDLGENIAIVFLEKRGFQVVDRNYRNSIGEIDIIAQKDDFYYVVEVKTLKIPSKQDITKMNNPFDPNISIIRDGDGIDWLKPEISLTKEKIRKIKQVALKYCMDFGIKEESLKFMGMCVSLYYSGSRVTKSNLLSCKVKVIPLLN